MTTYDFTHGDSGGMNVSGLPARTVIFRFDAAEVYAKYSTYTGSDLITIGTLKKGMIVLGAGAEIIESCTTIGVSNIGIQDGGAKEIINSVDPAAAEGTCYMAVQATGDMFDVAAMPVFLAADLDINVNPGTIVPTDGVIDVGFLVGQVCNFY
jgi:hypothetical protein